MVNLQIADTSINTPDKGALSAAVNPKNCVKSKMFSSPPPVPAAEHIAMTIATQTPPRISLVSRGKISL